MGSIDKYSERQQRLQDRNDAVDKMYQQLSSKRYKNIQLYNDKAIFQMIADKFYISPVTIEEIICGRHRLKKRQ
jgi:hypothetical protein